MAGSVNKVILVGHLGRDPEIRRTQSGSPVASFRMATSETWKDKTSEWQDKDGAKRWSTEVVLAAYRGEITLLDRQESNRPPPADDPGGYGTTRSRETGTADDPRTQRKPADIDDDIPL